MYNSVVLYHILYYINNSSSGDEFIIEFVNRLSQSIIQIVYRNPTDNFVEWNEFYIRRRLMNKRCVNTILDLIASNIVWNIIIDESKF